MEEVWKAVEGYEGKYEVSNLGRVRSLDRYVECKNGHILPCKGSLIMSVHHKSGYVYIGLTKGGKKHSLKLHRIVAEAFIPNPNNFTDVNHKDEDKTNNRADNLEWCDRSHNIRWKDGHLRRAKKLWRPVEQYTLNGEYIKTFPSIIEAADAVGISRALIGNVCAQRTHQKSAGGYRWRYAE